MSLSSRLEAELIRLRQSGAARFTNVYVVRQEGNAPVKIGRADDFPGRLAELQVANPYPLEVVALAYLPAKIERWLHKQLHDHRLHGEWFLLSDGHLLDLTAALRTSDRRHESIELAWLSQAP